MYKLCFFVPETHLESVKQALFEVGAGAVGDYDSCCWQSLGTGQFRGLEISTPYLGKKGQVEQVAEYKVEMVIKEQVIRQAIDALKTAHPYEEPAYDVIRLESF
jgi:hypothetical protein